MPALPDMSHEAAPGAWHRTGVLEHCPAGTGVDASQGMWSESSRFGSAADRDDARRPRAARRGHVDAIADLRAEQRAAERRGRWDAAAARDLDLQPLAALVLDLDLRADADDVARDRRVLV